MNELGAYLRRNAERTSVAMRAKMARGEWTGGRPAFGLRQAGAGLEVDHETFGVALAIYEMWGRGFALRAIADALIAAGVSTARGGQWHASTIRGIINSDAILAAIRREAPDRYFAVLVEKYQRRVHAIKELTAMVKQPLLSWIDKSMARKKPEQIEDLLDGMLALAQLVERIADRANDDPHLQLKAVREQRINIELIAKLRGELRYWAPGGVSPMASVRD